MFDSKSDDLRLPSTERSSLPRVLVIEDTPRFKANAKLLADCELCVVDNLSDALEKIDSFKPDYVLSDVIFPQFSQMSKPAHHAQEIICACDKKKIWLAFVSGADDIGVYFLGPSQISSSAKKVYAHATSVLYYMDKLGSKQYLDCGKTTRIWTETLERLTILKQTREISCAIWASLGKGAKVCPSVAGPRKEFLRRI